MKQRCFPRVGVGALIQALLDPLLSYCLIPMSQNPSRRISSLNWVPLKPQRLGQPLSHIIQLTVTQCTFEFGAASFKLDIGPFIETRSAINDEDICHLDIVAKTNTKDANSVGLGANFPRQVYTVYDMGSNEISLAQRNWNSNEDEILEIMAGKNEVPGLHWKRV